MFTGEYRHSVDDKGRLAVPARFRAQLEGGAVVCKWLDNCLAILTRHGWEELAEKTQAAIYQIIREAIDQALHRGPPQTLSVTMRQTADGGVETAITDDAPGERRRRSLEELEERARTLNGVLTVDQGEEAGTTVRVVLPPYATAR